ncbi:hypothetical protein EWM64_g7865 [Hericium alpestre]|uniref:Gylcosyl hydrolase 115 C-terminal domain-containing protein n=1 Tax=Hericium alpestre TaxID=135208 RepID=A0A4Y9ZRM7_9AGAM|nr:hypothetical protein EWM64_g7865 [Hericium alpestre]
MPRFSWPSVGLLVLSFGAAADAIGQTSCVSFQRANSSAFAVASNGQAAPVFLSSDEWPGVQLAASDFVSDIQKVTSAKPRLANVTSASPDLHSSTLPILVGTLGKSSLIDQVVNHTSLNVTSIEGKWEAFLTKVVKNPLPGLDQAYIIVGADKRGTIFALYDHSEQFGVSPWYWWADVPVTKHKDVFVSSSGCSHGTPTVKYRGLFLNDEQPALQNWAMEKFTNGTGAALTGSPFNHLFYTKLFELLLRMKANYLWPAQWSSAFNVDDPQNQFLADYYGIVMGTSYGNIRRFPVPSERNRTGGAGVYYHYDYVGSPRNFKWITVYEQMSLAVDREATQIWILNVGDLKPYEMSIEFFLTYGYDSEKWSISNFDSFVPSWATREFDLSDQDSLEVASIISNATRFLARRKPELINATTYSLISYREAENVLAEWKALNESASRIYTNLSSEQQPAFFQLVYHPVQAGYTLTNMWVSAGINNLRTFQARLSANDYADEVEQLFDQDYDLELEYHTLLDGKWDHIMDQTHVMYYYWQEPTQNTMPPVSKVSTRKPNIAGVMRITPEGTMATWPGDNPYQCANGYSCPPPAMSLDFYAPAGNRFVDLSSGGLIPFDFTATPNASWLKVTPTHGLLSPQNPEQRVQITVDWSQVSDVSSAVILLNATAKGQPPFSMPLTFTANHTKVPSGFKGFVEGDGTVSIETAHATRNTTVGDVTWTEIPDYGRTLSGVTPWPRLGNNEANYTAGSGPSLEYDFYNFNTIDQGGNVTVTVQVSPSLNAFGTDRPLALAVQLDSETPVTTYFIPPAAPGTSQTRGVAMTALKLVEHDITPNAYDLPSMPAFSSSARETPDALGSRGSGGQYR